MRNRIPDRIRSSIHDDTVSTPQTAYLRYPVTIRSLPTNCTVTSRRPCAWLSLGGQTPPMEQMESVPVMSSGARNMTTLSTIPAFKAEELISAPALDQNAHDVPLPQFLHQVLKVHPALLAFRHDDLGAGLLKGSRPSSLPFETVAMIVLAEIAASAPLP